MIKNNPKNDEITNDIPYDRALELVKEMITETLSSAPMIIRKYTKHLISSKGKFIRANSVIICAENKEGSIPPNAITLAAAIELLHLATLVHDDVIDNAELRRGNVTLQKKYGKKSAVICGDYLLCAALKTASSVTNKEAYLNISLPDYMGHICLGELNQHLNNHNLDLSLYQYFKIISGKTAALFEASFYAGAYFSGCPDKEIKKYRRLGFILGMIFQLTDDCMDFEETEKTALKPVQSDYEQGVITLPLIHALLKDQNFKEKAAHQRLTRSEINSSVTVNGGLEFARTVVNKYYNKAYKIITELDIEKSKREKLKSILDKVSRQS